MTQLFIFKLLTALYRYPRATALNEVVLFIASHERIAVLGANRSGVGRVVQNFAVYTHLHVRDIGEIKN